MARPYKRWTPKRRRRAFRTLRRGMRLQRRGGRRGGSIARLWRAVKARKPELKLTASQLTSFEGTAVPGTNVQTISSNLIQIGQGVGQTQRVGNQVKVKRIIYHFEMGARNLDATPFFVEVFRAYLVEWKRTAPTATMTPAEYAVMVRTDVGLTNPQTPRKYIKTRDINFAKSHKYKTLKTLNASISTSGTAIADPFVRWQTRRFRIVLKYRGDGRLLQFADTSTGSALGWAHGLFLHIDGEVNWTPPQHWICNAYTQVWFTDA